MSGHRPTVRFGLGTKLALVVVISVPCFGQRTYEIYRATSPVNVNAKLDERDWQQAPSVGDFHFPWFKEGSKEQTVAKMLWDDENLYVS